MVAPVQLLEQAGRGEDLDDADWGALVAAWLDGAATDAQMSAALARASVSGLSVGAQREMIEELVSRGERLDLSPLGDSATIVAGGVADSLELIAPPIAAATGLSSCSVVVRGRDSVLGGRDKLDPLFGMLLEMPASSVAEQVRDEGVAVVSPTSRFGSGSAQLEGLIEQTGLGLAPAVAGPALACRFLVSGANLVGVSLTHGAGGLLDGPETARRVQEVIEEVARDWERTVCLDVEDATEPLGPAIGSSLELATAGEILSGGGDERLRARAAGFVGRLLEAAGRAPTGAGAGVAEAALDDGRALAAAERWLEAQGADPSVWTDPGRLPAAPHRQEVVAASEGVLERVDAGALGEVARWVGAGRLHPSQSIDPVAGVEIFAHVGSRVSQGEALAVVHSRDAAQAEEGARQLGAAFTVKTASADDA
jgi:thymidine phosphorylase